MYASKRKVEIMQQLNEKAMTDEETDCDDIDSNRLVKRTPPWRSNKLTKLIKTLDSRKDMKSDTMPKKDRKTGCPSERNPPKDLPKWALRDDSTSEPSLSDASSTPESPMQCPTQNQGLTPVSSRSSGLPGLTPLSRFSATHASFHSQTPPSTPTMHDESIPQSPSNSFSSDSDYDENDETSAWIRAVTGLR